jgi:hypothetical protein
MRHSNAALPGPQARESRVSNSVGHHGRYAMHVIANASHSFTDWSGRSRSQRSPVRVLDIRLSPWHAKPQYRNDRTRHTADPHRTSRIAIAHGTVGCLAVAGCESDAYASSTPSSIRKISDRDAFEIPTLSGSEGLRRTANKQTLTRHIRPIRTYLRYPLPQAQKDCGVLPTSKA